MTIEPITDERLDEIRANVNFAESYTREFVALMTADALALLSRLDKAEAGLRPFAEFADVYDADALLKMGLDPSRYDLSDDSSVATGGQRDRQNYRTIKVSDVRRARAILAAAPPPSES